MTRALRPMRRMPRLLRVSAGVMTCVAMSLTACGQPDSPVATTTDASSLIWRLKLNTKAVTLAVGQTQVLVAMPRAISGDTLTSSVAPKFVSTDTTRVRVDANGTVTAVKPTTSAVSVIASLLTNGVTTADTASIVVTQNPQAVGSISIHPTGNDSAKSAVSAYQTLDLVEKDTAGNTITGLAVQLISLDTTILTFNSGYVYGKSPGTTTIIATTTSYGVVKSDTVTWTITNPTSLYLYVYGKASATPLSPVAAVITVNGTVNVYNASGAVASITFDTPSANIVGNPTNMATYAIVPVKFTAAGTYTYKDNLGNAGTIYVLPN